MIVMIMIAFSCFLNWFLLEKIDDVMKRGGKKDLQKFFLSFPPSLSSILSSFLSPSSSWIVRREKDVQK